MSIPARGAVMAVAALCACFTGIAPARAGEAQGIRAFDDPDPLPPDGLALRAGTAVGWLRLGGLGYTVLGADVGAGLRLGRITVEATYAYLGIQERGPSALALGHIQRVGAAGRLELLRLGRRWVGPRAWVAAYAEVAAGRRWYAWYAAADPATARRTPAGIGRNDLAAGTGFVIEHLAGRGPGVPARFGWQLGWQLASVPPPANDDACHGTARCSDRSRRTSPVAAPVADAALVVTSSFYLSW